MSSPTRLLAAALACATSIAVAPLAGATAPHEERRNGHHAPGHHNPGRGYTGWLSFERVSTFGVYENLPEGVDPDTETAAEIAAVTSDGMTVVYSNSPQNSIEFIDITDPSAPRPDGRVDLDPRGAAQAEPTSVAVAGDYILVAVNTSASYTDPSGRLDVFSSQTRERVASLDLGGQPDAIAVAPGGGAAMVTIENERDEDLEIPGGGEGDLPQLPAGFATLVNLAGEPAGWAPVQVALTGADGAPLPVIAEAGIVAPIDPEPEYVTINEAGVAAISLQENNGIVLVDTATGEVSAAFSAGEVTLNGVDVEDDGLFDDSASLTAAREPDGIAWIDDRYLATANEGDYVGGSRGWSVFDTHTGDVAYDSGTKMEDIALRYGLHNEKRADNKGNEPENVTTGSYSRGEFAFVGSERSNFVAVYDIRKPTKPRFVQTLPTTNGPEGLLAVPQRDLFIAAAEVDEADEGIRSTVSIYQLGRGESDGWPALDSGARGKDPIGWGALSGLTGGHMLGRLFAVSDSAYAQGRIYEIQAWPGVPKIHNVFTVTDEYGPVEGLDLEGIAWMWDGFWLASEGKTGEQNQLLRTDRRGHVIERVSLPSEVAERMGKWGVEGLAIGSAQGHKAVYVALQRPVEGEDVARIGRYDPVTGQWAWMGYPLQPQGPATGWVGLSGLEMLPGGMLGVIERDKASGPNAEIKRVYQIPTEGFVSTADSFESLPVASKTLRYDLLDNLASGNGWVQEKVEGFARDGAGREYAVTDNDGVDDASGETQFMLLNK